MTLPQLRGGAVKGLANLSPRRSAAVPDIPSADESGVPGLYVSAWFGFFAPRGTPNEAIAKLNTAMVEALADSAVRARFTELGLDVAPRDRQTPASFGAFHQAEVAKWWPVIRQAGMKGE